MLLMLIVSLSSFLVLLIIYYVYSVLDLFILTPFDSSALVYVSNLELHSFLVLSINTISFANSMSWGSFSTCLVNSSMIKLNRQGLNIEP